MTGKPVTRAFFTRLDIDGGIEYLCELVVEGLTMKAIGRRYGISRQLVYEYIDSEPGHKALFREARRKSADAMVDDALEIIDNVPEEAAAVSKAKEQVGFRKWLAGTVDREKYGPPEKAATVQVNIGELHLDALRKVGGPTVVGGVEVHTLPAVPAKELTA